MDRSTNTPTTSVGLLRHSRTLWNEKKILQGQKDSPLSDQGQKMAAEWGSHLLPFEWDLILASDLGRALTTAELINSSLAIPVHTSSKLREQDWGNWTGMTLETIKKADKKELKHQVAKGWLFTPPGGESRQQVLERASGAIIDFCACHPMKKTLVICHEGVIKCLLYHLLQRKFLPGEQKILSPYNVHMISMEETRLSFGKINFYQLPC